MRTSLRLAAVVLSGVLLAACSGGVGGSTAATVNDTAISVEQLEERVQAQLSSDQFASLPAEQRDQQAAQLQTQVLSQMILFEIIEQAAAERGIEASEEEVQTAWDEQVDLAGGEEQLKERLGELGLTEAEAREQLATQVKLDKLREEAGGGSEVTDEQVRALFEERADQWETVNASHILVETEDEANEIVAELEGGAAFEQLAEERSQDPGSAELGGELGDTPRGRFVEEFEDAVWNAEPGEIVGPVQTQFGWHVIRVNSFDTTTFEDVRDTLREELEGQQAQAGFEELFRELITAAEVEVSGRFGTWDAEQGQVVLEDNVDGGGPGQQVDPGGGLPGGQDGTEPPADQ